MGVVILRSTLDGGFTPLCELCGSQPSHDISEQEYLENKVFWDNWVCCNKKIRKQLVAKQQKINKANEHPITGIVAPKCPHCQKRAKLTTGRTVYPRRPDLATKVLWICRDCDAWCGVHDNSPRFKALGTPANKELRQLRRQAHSFFDPLWQLKQDRDSCARHVARNSGYAWIATKLGIPVEECHIAMFNKEKCQAVVNLCQPFTQRLVER